MVVMGCTTSTEDSVIPKEDCETKKYALVTISNTSSNPYNLYVDDVFRRKIDGKAIVKDIKINEGNGHKLYVEQISGYLLYPATKTVNFNIVRCSDYSWIIP